MVLSAGAAPRRRRDRRRVQAASVFVRLGFGDGGVGLRVEPPEGVDAVHELCERGPVFRSRLIRRADKQPQERLRRRVLGLVVDEGDTLKEANNYASSLVDLKHLERAKSLLRKAIPVARRVLGEAADPTLQMRWNYARALCRDGGATLNDLREAVTTLEETEPIARRVLGGTYPITVGIEKLLRTARAALRARETPPGSRAN